MQSTMKNTILKPPDGGWGWIVLIAAVTINVLIPGMVKSFGVLFVEFLEVFKSSPTTASWMPALCYFLYSSLGPLSSILSMKYSYKTVTVIGGTFAATGMMLSYFATSVPYLYFSYGIMVGIGAGLTCPVSVYIVTEYFEKYRGFANGMCISGSCIGTMLLPPILQYLLDTVGHRGAVLIMGAITSNSILCGLLYHPVEKHMKRVSVSTDNSGVDNKALNLDEPLDAKKFGGRILPSDQSGVSMVPFERYRKILSPDDYSPESKDSTLERQDPSSDNQAQEITKMRELKNETDTESSNFSSTVSSDEKYSLPPMEESKTIPSLKTCNRLCPSQGLNKQICLESSTMKKDTSSRSVDIKFDLEKQDSEQEKSKRKFFDLSILKDPIYLVILISNATSAISNTNFMILLPSYANAEGFDKNSSAFLLSIVSALDLIGRIGGASLSDIDFIPKYYYFVGGLGFSGIALALLPMASSYKMLSFFCGLFGLSSGTYIGITTVVLADMLGAERLSSSYGIALFVNGVLQLLGPPLIGIIYEQVLSYKPIFLALGIILILGSCLWAFVPIVRRRDKKKEMEANK